MTTYIELKNGVPINYPFEDFNKQPSSVAEYAEFIRQPTPHHLDRNKLQVFDSNYILAEDGVSYTDSWYIRDMTDKESEKETKIRVEGLKSSVNALIDTATLQLDSADINDALVWQAYLEALDNVTYSNPFTVILPKMPIKNNAGIWISIDNAGEKPDVIG